VSPGAARRTWRRFAANRGAVGGLVFLIALVAVAALAPVLVPRSPWEVVARPFTLPGAVHPFGTDTLGRDILAGVLHGARVSLLIGVAATAVSTAIGVSVGLVAGYRGGWTDEFLMRATEFFQIVPGFVLAVVLIAIFQPSLLTVVLAIGVVGWSPMARLVRAEVMSLRAREFVLAERALGAADAKIMLGTILPNTVSVICVYASLLVATSILFESSLSFLGLGDPNHMSWGYMVGAARGVLRIAWWMPVFPGLAILLTVLSINLVGDGISDVLNPRSRARTPTVFPNLELRATPAEAEPVAGLASTATSV